MRDIYFPSLDGKSTIHACLWEPAGKARGVVQIIHGMQEYAERYSPFAEFLTQNGFIVCADDHLGHGKSAATADDLGYFCESRDTDVVIGDIRRLYTTVGEQTGDLPFFILGHSMGSFFCRKYIAKYGGDYSGAIIMGSGYKSRALLNFALFAVRFNALFCGWRHRSKLITKLAFGSYNKKFKGAEDKNSWLSVNPLNVEKYNADPLCGVPFTNNGYYILFSVIKEACAKKTFAATPANLPLYLISGGDDPVGDYGKGVEKAYAKYRAAGAENVALKLYPGYRHEILNDDCNAEVCGDILEFIESCGADNG